MNPYVLNYIQKILSNPIDYTVLIGMESKFENIATSMQPFCSFLNEKMFNFVSNKRQYKEINVVEPIILYKKNGF